MLSFKFSAFPVGNTNEYTIFVYIRHMRFMAVGYLSID